MVAALAVAGIAHAVYPDRPIKIVVPYPAGGAADGVNRLVAENLSKRLGQPVVVDARPGASGFIAAQLVQKAPADGYTILGFTSTFAAHPGLFKEMPYDMERDFTPLLRTLIIPIVVVVNPTLPVTSMAELVEYSKRQPAGGLAYATAGNASGPHITGEYFKSLTGANLTHAPYKGEGPAVVDVLGGHVKLMISSSTGVLPHIRSGKVRAIAVANPTRLDFLPDVKTIAESGYPGFEMFGWQGMAVATGTPPDVVKLLSETIRSILEQEDVKTKVAGFGLIMSPQGPADFKKYIADQTRMYTKIIQSANIKAD